MTNSDSIDAFHLLDLEFRNIIPENTGPIENGMVLICGQPLDPVSALLSDDGAYTTARSKWINDKITDAYTYVTKISKLKKGLIGRRINDLSDSINASGIVPFVGSGMSAQSGLPTWENFLNEMRQDSGISDSDYANLLRSGSYEEIASQISKNINLDLAEELMIHYFEVNSIEEVRGGIRLLPLLFNNSVITTNYDNVLERAYKKFGLSFDCTLSGNQLKDYTAQKKLGSKILAKIHGDHRFIGTRVLTKEEYDRNYTSGRRFRVELGRIYRSQGLLFLGCSLTVDRTLQVFSSIPRNQRYSKHYALLPIPVSESEAIDDAVLQDRENYLTMSGIYPIWYTGNPGQAIEHILIYLLNKKGVI